MYIVQGLRNVDAYLDVRLIFIEIAASIVNVEAENTS